MARRDEVAEGQVGNTRKVRLPALWPGSTRYNKRLLEDAMALVARYGKPTFFITFTANAKWPEIRALLDAQGCNHQSSLERPDAIIGRGLTCNCDIHKLHDYVRRNMTHSHKEGKCYAEGQVPPSGNQRCKLGYPRPLIIQSLMSRCSMSGDIPCIGGGQNKTENTIPTLR
jgi:hypothetical protein